MEGKEKECERTHVRKKERKKERKRERKKEKRKKERKKEWKKERKKKTPKRKSINKERKKELEWLSILSSIESFLLCLINQSTCKLPHRVPKYFFDFSWL